MVKRVIIGRSEGERLVDLLKGVREAASSGSTTPGGNKVLENDEDFFWDRSGGETASMRQVDEDLEEARQRIADAKLELEETQVRLDDAEQAATEAQGRLDNLDDNVLPDIRNEIQVAAAQAAADLNELEGNLTDAQLDLDAAKTDLTQLESDLASESAAREALAISTAGSLGELDTALGTAFPSGAFDVASELAQTVRGTVIEYAVSDSATTAPTSGWSTDTPSRTPGQYIWMRTIITYADDSTVTSSPVLLTGNDGADGQPGPPGEDGSGVNIIGTLPSEGDLPSSATAGDAYLIDGFLYVWTGTSWENVGKIQGPQGPEGPPGEDGNPGEPGADGTGVASLTPFYRRQATGTAAPAQPTAMTPAGWAHVEPDWLLNTELYRVERVVYTNATFAYTAVVKVAVYAGIDAAVAAANGKNVNTYSDLPAASKPGPAPAIDNTRTVGDIHRNRNEVTGEVWAEYQWSGSLWKPVKYGDAILTSLDVGKLSAGTVVTPTAVIDKLWVDGVMAKSVASSAITVAPGNLLPDPNGNTTIGRNAYANLGFVWSNTDKAWVKSSPGSSNQTKPNAGGDYTSYPLEGGRTYRLSFEAKVEGTTGGGRYAIYYTKRDGTTAFVGDGVEGPGGDTEGYTPIPADTWTKVDRTWVAPEDAVMGGFALQVNNVPAGAQRVLIRNPFAGVKAGAVMIENGAINADKVNAESVAGAIGQFIDLTTDNLTAGGATIDVAVINKLWTDGIAAKAVTASKVAVSSGNGYKYADFTSWPDADATWSDVGGKEGGGAVLVDASSDTVGTYDHLDDPTNATRVSEGRTYRIGTWFMPVGEAATEGVRVYVRWYNGTGGPLGIEVQDFGGDANTWTWGEQERTAPTGAVFMVLGFFAYSTYSGSVLFSNPSVTPLVGTVLIEDGAISTSKLYVTEEMSANIASFMSVETKKLIVSEEAILNHATLIGQTVVDDINVQGKLIGTDGVFTGTVDFSNVNVTGELLASSISGEYLYGNTIEGADVWTRQESGYSVHVGGDAYPWTSPVSPGVTGKPGFVFSGAGDIGPVGGFGAVPGVEMGTDGIGTVEMTILDREANPVGGRAQVSRGTASIQGPPTPTFGRTAVTAGTDYVRLDAIDTQVNVDSSSGITAYAPEDIDIKTDSWLYLRYGNSGRADIVPASGTGYGLQLERTYANVNPNNRAGFGWLAGSSSFQAVQYTSSGSGTAKLEANSVGARVYGRIDVDGNFSIQGAGGINGNLYYYGAISTSSDPNVFISSAGGILSRSTSSRRYKRNIVDWNPDAEAVLALQPRQWQHDDPESEIDERWHVGFVAEEVDELGLKGLVSYAGDGRGGWRPESLNYGRFAAAHQVVLKKHEQEITELRQENDDLRARLDRLEALLPKETE